MIFVSSDISVISNSCPDLHSKGIMHGDVYAHNILTATNDASIIGDFGAASVYDRDMQGERWRESLDVLGFGRLLSELIERIIPDEHSTAVSTKLESIAGLCVTSSSTRRPGFERVVDLLDVF